MTTPTPTGERKCTCGEPNSAADSTTERLVHRYDGKPCHWEPIKTAESKLRDEWRKEFDPLLSPYGIAWGVRQRMENWADLKLSEELARLAGNVEKLEHGDEYEPEDGVADDVISGLLDFDDGYNEAIKEVVAIIRSYKGK